MRILYLIGNGFDLHVDLETSYPQFLKYYLNEPIPAGLDDVGKHYIERLKNDINSNIELWSDLELQFGKHMSKLGKEGKEVHAIEDELDIINDDIREKLSAYIANQDAHSFFSDDAQKKFLEDIVNPERNLRDYEANIIKQQRTNVWHTTGHSVDIITFNYTSTIEHLLGKAPVKSAIFEIHEPVHVHGYYNRRMVLGVNDVSQIDNESLRNNPYAVDALVKSDNNHSYGDNHTNACRNLIRNAQLICCYGLSFGDTDKIWWQLVCEEMKRRGDVYLIIYAYAGEMPNYSNSGHKLQNIMRLEKEKLLSKGGVEDSLRQQLAQRIFVAINDPIFNIKVLPIRKIDIDSLGSEGLITES